MRKVILILFAVFILGSIYSCSLFKVQLASDSVPLSKTDLNLRIATQTFLSASFSRIDNVTDSVRLLDSDPKAQANSLLWAINTQNMLQQTVFQNNPKLALAETWIFVRQMWQLVESEKSDSLFGRGTPVVVDAAKGMEIDLSDICARFLSPKEADNLRSFVNKYVSDNAINDLKFKRVPVAKEWLQFNNLPDTIAVVTVGALPEVVSDFSTRMSMSGESFSSNSKRYLELVALRNNINAKSIARLTDSINYKVNAFLAVADQAPEYIDQAAASLHRELAPLLESLNGQIAATMDGLSSERAAIEVMIARERQAVMTELDKISANVTETAMKEVKSIITSSILYLTLFFAVVIFLPFGIGFFVGRIWTKAKKK